MRATLMDGPKRPRFKVRKRRRFWVRPGRTSEWWDKFVAGVVVEEEWKENFRMSRASLMSLAERLRPHIEVYGDFLFVVVSCYAISYGPELIII